ncbi:MAG: putative sensor protein [Firmicutes bacterium]|nr:putative sensor protein [Bacillota bacterium]
METNSLLPFYVLITDDNGILLSADDHLEKFHIGTSITNLIGTDSLPLKTPALFQTVYGPMILYPFFEQGFTLKGYIGLVISKNIQNEVIDRLTKENMELEMMLEGMHDGLALLDREGKVIRVNKGFTELSGIPKSEMLCLTTQEGERIGRWSASSAIRAILSKKPITFLNEYTYNNKINSGVVTAQPLLDENNNVVGVVCNIRDIARINKLRDEFIEIQLQENTYSQAVKMITNEQAVSSDFLVFRSAKIGKLLQCAMKYAAVDVPLLITGESGSGKEVIADLVYKNSKRKDAPFFKVNCGAIPDALLESELFGYDEGAFTGAKKSGHVGLCELAHQGTIFLDEIGEVSMTLQSKLLRFIEKQEFYRVGSTKLRKVDVRIISATNRDLEEMITAKQFRLDLFHRLKVLHLHMPPLRERAEDVMLLIDHFMEYYNKKYNTNKKLSGEVLNILLAYEWPGNIRELKNLLGHLVILSDGPQILMKHLPDDFHASLQESFYNHEVKSDSTAAGIDDIVEKGLSYREARDLFERTYLTKALEKYGSIRNTAANVGITHAAIIKKFAQYGAKVPTRKK